MTSHLAGERPGERLTRAGRGSGGAPVTMTHTALTPAPTGGHLLGYARVSTAEQDPALQQDALTAAGCYRTFTDTASGVDPARTELTAVLDQLRPGDTSWSGGWTGSTAPCRTSSRSSWTCAPATSASAP